MESILGVGNISEGCLRIIFLYMEIRGEFLKFIINFYVNVK